jgi:hypothetical protein
MNRVKEAFGNRQSMFFAEAMCRSQDGNRFLLDIIYLIDYI